MPNRWAVATGNWSSTATWNNGAVLGIPTGSDDVFISGSAFTVTIDQDINVLSLNTLSTGSIAAGGSFSVVSSRNISTGIIRGNNVNFANTIAITGTGITVNITGSIFGQTGGSSGGTIGVGTVSSIVNISGSITGVGGTIGAVMITGTSTRITIIGNTTGGTASGAQGIQLAGTNNNLILIGDTFGGTSGPGLNIAPSSAFTASIIGNTFNTTGITPLSISSTGLGTVTMTGSINGGLGSAWHGAGFSATNLTFNFTGSINAGGAGGTNAHGLSLTSNNTTTLNIVGSVNGGAGGNGIAHVGGAIVNINGPLTAGLSLAIQSTSTGIINITGSVTAAAAAGILNSGTGIINVTGSVTAGPAASAFGVTNTSTGTVRVTTAVASLFAAGINNTLATGTGSFESAIYASNGTQPWSGFCKLRSSANNFITTATDTGGTKTLVDPNNALFGLPAASDVRLGTSYNFGANTGTCAIPSASQVAAGIAVDNTVGTAVLTAANVASAVWNTQTTAITVSGSIGDRFKNSATVSSTGDQIAALTI